MRCASVPPFNRATGDVNGRSHVSSRVQDVHDCLLALLHSLYAAPGDERGLAVFLGGCCMGLDSSERRHQRKLGTNQG